ncbi:glucose-1-phosphate adenylyltransferase subunit GlgD [Eubacteriales bacterium OttesenSCG-928-N13]|nr:glucose-1-phosphate adenylyltransferase subunit GlgD [Eubacteriales bacterium OttesenSCG-928-N13]
MKNVMGLIYTTKNDITMRELTSTRAVAALPVVGRYRMIDFMLSNMVNSGIRNVGVIVQKNYHSLMDHLGSGQEWDLHTKTDGLSILPPFQTREDVGNYEGTLDALRSNIGYLRRAKQEYVILTGSYGVFSATYDDFVTQHIESSADISVMYSKSYSESRIFSSMAGNHAYFKLDDDGSVMDIEIGPNVPTYPNFSMTVLLMKRTLLMHLVDQAVAHGMHDIHKDLLSYYVKNKLLKVKGFEYEGYHRCIESISSYYRFNMDMLDYNTRQEVFGLHPIYTKVRDEVPANYLRGAVANNSLVADGCIIEGTVINSVLFRGVRVRRGAVVKNSVIMQECDIQDGVEVDNVIFDKAVTIRSGKLVGQAAYPIVIGKGITL